MKNYRITVNGVAYDVAVEELGTAAPAPVAPAVAPAPVAVPAPAPAPAAGGTAGSVKIIAPMPGTINRINVKIGDAVKQGDVLLVLEAMKMENDITAPQDGTVSSIEVNQGATVATDAVLITLA